MTTLPPESTIDERIPIGNECIPEPVYNTQEPALKHSESWQVGDLVRQGGKLILIVALGIERQHKAPDEAGEWIVVTTFRELICLTSTGFVWQADGPTERVDFLHNTGLVYAYRNREQVQRDFRTGLFTPYFEIL